MSEPPNERTSLYINQTETASLSSNNNDNQNHHHYHHHHHENNLSSYSSSSSSLLRHLLLHIHHRSQPCFLFNSIPVIFLIVSLLLTGAFLTHYSNKHHLDQPQQTRPSSFYDGPIVDNTNPDRYTATQFISFTINTLGGYADEGECDGRDVEEESGICYLGNPTNLTADIAHRVKLLFKVLDKIKNDVNSDVPRIDHREDVLKIFMVPEFYFRGAEGAYPIEILLDHGVLDDALDQIHDYIKDDAFNDYLFVFGTIIAASRWDVNNAGPKRVWDAPTMDTNQVLYYNFAPVSKGGKTEHHNHRYLVTKKTISTIDFLSNNSRLPNPLRHNIYQYDAIPTEFRQFLEKTRHTRIIEDNIIHIDGIRIGLEICLDHMIGILWNSLQEQAKVEKLVEPKLVDVQLITSAGMQINYGPNPLVPGGVVYMCDGGATSAACWRPQDDQANYNPERLCRNPSPTGLKHFPPIGTQLHDKEDKHGTTQGETQAKANQKKNKTIVEKKKDGYMVVNNQTQTRPVPSVPWVSSSPSSAPPPSLTPASSTSTKQPYRKRTYSTYSTFFTVAACEDILDYDLLAGYFSIYAGQGCTMTLNDYGIEVMDEMKHSLPSIEYYPTVDLPKRKGQTEEQR